MERDHLILRMWKTMKAIFSCVSPGLDLPKLEPPYFRDFHMLNEAWNCMTPLENLESGTDTTLSKIPSFAFLSPLLGL